MKRPEREEAGRGIYLWKIQWRSGCYFIGKCPQLKGLRDSWQLLREGSWKVFCQVPYNFPSSFVLRKRKGKQKKEKGDITNTYTCTNNYYTWQECVCIEDKREFRFNTFFKHKIIYILDFFSINQIVNLYIVSHIKNLIFYIIS